MEAVRAALRVKASGAGFFPAPYFFFRSSVPDHDMRLEAQFLGRAMLTLITGGARSGKSSFAQSLCNGAESVVYIATATAIDEEMQARIARHRADRPVSWHTVEEPLAVPEAIVRHSVQAAIVLVDCITLWVSNLLYQSRADDPEVQQRDLLGAVNSFRQCTERANVVAVTNEVGCGLVPETPLGRLFRDLHGLANQRLASAAHSVYLLTAGIPLRIK